MINCWWLITVFVKISPIAVDSYTKANVGRLGGVSSETVVMKLDSGPAPWLLVGLCWGDVIRDNESPTFFNSIIRWVYCYTWAHELRMSMNQAMFTLHRTVGAETSAILLMSNALNRWSLTRILICIWKLNIRRFTCELSIARWESCDYHDLCIYIPGNTGYCTRD